MAQSTNALKKSKGILGALALVTIVIGLYWGLIVAPPDADQGDLQRIMYLHIPTIIAAYSAIFLVFIGSSLYLWKKEKRDDVLAHASAEIAVLLIALVIVEGSIWAKPTWGVWWTWDARLTTTAILLLIFVGYLLLRASTEDETRAASAAAVLGIIGALDVPLIHMSVYWWRTIHQPPSIFRPDKAPAENIPWPFLVPLMVNMVAFLLLFFYLLSLRYRVGEMRQEIKALRLERGR